MWRTWPASEICELWSAGCNAAHLTSNPGVRGLSGRQVYTGETTGRHHRNRLPAQVKDPELSTLYEEHNTTDMTPASTGKMRFQYVYRSIIVPHAVCATRMDFVWQCLHILLLLKDYRYVSALDVRFHTLNFINPTVLRSKHVEQTKLYGDSQACNFLTSMSLSPSLHAGRYMWTFDSWESHWVIKLDL